MCLYNVRMHKYIFKRSDSTQKKLLKTEFKTQVNFKVIIIDIMSLFIDSLNKSGQQIMLWNS